MQVDAAIVNAFTFNGEGGNPAAVVLDADRLTTEQKLIIACEIGLSETAFVSASKMADFKLEFFTPTRQIAHCGHATVATFAYLIQQGQLVGTRSSKETIDGVREILLDGEMVFMEQRAPTYENVPADELTQVILPALGLDADSLNPMAVPAYVNTGNTFLVLPLRDRQGLAAVVPDFDAIQVISEQRDLIGFYPFVIGEPMSGFDAEARMFAPRYGIHEEAATGMAAGPLAAFLHDRMNSNASYFRIAQGALMPDPSPSDLGVRLDVQEQRINRLLAGGRATVKGSRTISL